MKFLLVKLLLQLASAISQYALGIHAYYALATCLYGVLFVPNRLSLQWIQWYEPPGFVIRWSMRSYRPSGSPRPNSWGTPREWCFYFPNNSFCAFLINTKKLFSLALFSSVPLLSRYNFIAEWMKVRESTEIRASTTFLPNSSPINVHKII